MQNLPIGIQTFSEIINNNYLYVDKTEILEKLIKSGKYYFLSRPRRFGKSLLISTLEEIFSGNKNLFKNLYIYDKIDWEVFPIIRLDMSNAISSGDKEIFGKSIINMLNLTADEYKVIIDNPIDYTDAFRKLIFELGKINKVVILIDEYDKPIIDHITNKELSLQNRNLLRDLYSVLKAYDQHIKFCLLTGVSKFSKVSVFSGLNNLQDITLNENYSTLCGITQNELEAYFDDRLILLTEKFNTDKETLKRKVKEWYNGYSWDGVNTVYNPFSILSFFNELVFRNFWFSTGTPTFLIDKFKEGNLKIEELNNFIATDVFFNSFDIEKFDYRSLLFQTGYLTITKLKISIDEMEYTIDYPNKEVKDSFLAHIVSAYIKKEPNDINYLNNKLRLALQNNNLKDFFDILKSLFSSIPYQLHIPKEAYYHSLFYLIMELMGVNMEIERNISTGRIDGVIEFENNIYIIEFKYLAENQKADELLNKALNQIKTKEYFAPYLLKDKPVKYLAVVLNKEIIEYKIED